MLVITCIYAAPPYITQTGVQQFTITIPANSTSNFVTVASVNTNLAFIFPGGMTGMNNTNPNISEAYCQITSPTTISAFRSFTDGTNTVTLSGSLVDPTPNLVKSVQKGTIVIPLLTNLATISINAVNTNNTSAIYMGRNVTNVVINVPQGMPALSCNGTTLSAQTFSNTVTSPITVAYTLLEFQPGVLNQPIQHYIFPYSQSGAAALPPLNSNVNNNNATILYCGGTATSGGGSYSIYASRTLVNSTNMDIRSSAAGTGTNFLYLDVVEFSPGVLYSPIQKFSQIMANTNTIGQTLSPAVNISKTAIVNTCSSWNAGAFVNMAYWRLASPTSLLQIRNNTGGNQTSPRANVLEFSTSSMMENLFMEGF